MKRFLALTAAAALNGCASATTMPASADTEQISARPEGAHWIAVRHASVEIMERYFDRLVILDAAARFDLIVIDYAPAKDHPTSYAKAKGAAVRLSPWQLHYNPF